MVMPEPIVSGNGYRVRISDAGGDNVRCLDRFYLILLEDSAAGIGASINVVSSTSESITLAIGVWFNYDNESDSSVGHFIVDLYKAERSGDCGNWQTSICDKPDSSCKDSAGDYNIVIRPQR